MPIPVQSAPLTLSALAQHCQAECVGDPAFKITGVNTLERATPSELVFVVQAKFMSRLQQTRAQAIILPPALREQLPKPFHCIVHPQPQWAFSRLCEVFYPDSVPPKGRHPTACVDATAVLDDTVSVGPYVVIGAKVVIGSNTRLDAHAVIGEGARIGKGCWIGSHACIHPHCDLGDRVHLHHGSVIGADGF